jgi:glycosyltransferase involved in cell wall biosynthesis
MTASPRVTILIPVFNRERFVDEAIRSVLEQDFQDFELLLVDDGSTDGTPEVLRSWQARDPRIVVVTAPQNLGIPGALNLGLQHARAPYVARLDSDDLMMPHRLAAQCAVLDERPDVVLASSMYEIVDAGGNHIATWRGEEPHELVAHLLGFYNIVGGHSQVMYRLSDVMAEGGYSLDHPASEDYDLWVRLLQRGRILTLPIVGMRQRDHGARSNVRYGATKRANWTSIMRRSLAVTLERDVADDEIDALITVWRHDGVTGHGALADRTMREAFAKFCVRHSDRALQRWLRRRTARQWLEAAGQFARLGHRIEAVRYLLRAARWSPPTVFAMAKARLFR